MHRLLTDKYKAILDENHNIVECDLLTWAKWIEENPERRIVKQEHVGGWWISTVFLGMNHGWGGTDLWFESMAFGEIHPAADEDGREMDRYATWAEAEAGHAAMVAYYRAKLS